MNTSAHARVQLSYMQVQVVGVCEVHTLAGMPELVIVLDRPGLRLPMRKKENVERRKVKTTLQSFEASTELECERQQ